MISKDDILRVSLDLFNTRGERHTTSNHIALALNISSGDLYCHFRNKNEIIYAIFKQYESLVDKFLTTPDTPTFDIEHLSFYFEAIYESLWSYRFLYRDLEHLLSIDSRLSSEYRAFALRCQRTAVEILKLMQKNNVLKHMDGHEEAIITNQWLIITNWITYLRTIDREKTATIDRKAVQRGIYQTLVYALPYITDEYLDAMNALKDKYGQAERREPVEN